MRMVVLVVVIIVIVFNSMIGVAVAVVMPVVFLIWGEKRFTSLKQNA